ncbi:MAG: prolyl oligopeptidase family serine peptidase [Planctomycetia bacterium]|nr:prolyl oligopeptidase family serine peptidase [Planctomycetia bacterium]
MNLLLLALLLSADPQPQRMEWTVEGTKREAVVFLPAEAPETGSPVVFGFHGHGGTMQNAARTFQIQKRWPEAIVVYMQGLPTPGRLTDPEGKRPGWQHAQGEQEDRDLKFFDAVLATLKEKHNADAKRIYATGHSNGGGFTYLLWGARPDVFAAVAPSAAGGARNLRGAKPCPMLHVAGEKDPLVTLDVQKRSIDAVLTLNGCEAEGMEWAKGCTIYASSKNAPVVTFIHGGDHKYPAEAPELIVKFFKEHAKK